VEQGMNINIDGKKMTSPSESHQYLKKIFGFPRYYGNNLDALYDVLSGFIQRPLRVTWQHYETSYFLLGDYADRIYRIFEEVEGVEIIKSDD
jgi:ribonuclease inhibitor